MVTNPTMQKLVFIWVIGDAVVGLLADWLVCWLVALLRGCLVSVTWWPVGWLVG